VTGPLPVPAARVVTVRRNVRGSVTIVGDGCPIGTRLGGVVNQFPVSRGSEQETEDRGEVSHGV